MYRLMLVAAVALITIRIFFKRRYEQKIPAFLRVCLQIVFAGIWIGLLGSTANELVRTVNHAKMPVIEEIYFRGEVSVDCDAEHSRGGSSSHVSLPWLCDYIDPSKNDIMHSFYPRGDKISPGDLAIMGCRIPIFCGSILAIVALAALILRHRFHLFSTQFY